MPPSALPSPSTILIALAALVLAFGGGAPVLAGADAPGPAQAEAADAQTHTSPENQEDAAHQGAADQPAADREARELALEEAVSLALDADVEHSIARLEWENARIEQRIAQAAGPLTPYERLEHQLNQRRAENAYASNRRAVIIGVARDYFELQQAERMVEIRRQELEVARRELEIVREQVRIGDRGPQDELREKNRVASAELAATTTARNHANRMSEFRRRLGLPEEAPLVLVDAPQAVPWTLSLEESLEAALAKDFGIWERATNLELTRMDLEHLRVQNPPPLTLERAENNLRITELNARRGDEAFENTVIADFHDLEEAGIRLETSEVDYELAVESHEIARRQFEAGLLTDLDWQRAEIERLQAEHNRIEAVHTYVFTRLAYLDTLGLPLGIGGAEAR